MDQLEKELGKDDYGKIRRDIKKALLNRKEEFCKADYLSIKAAKAQLMTLITKIMMEEAGFMIDEILDHCQRKTELLKRERDCLTQYQDDLEARTSNNNKLRRNADEANKDLVEAIEEELKEYDSDDNQE